jgi:hypothetical protein
MKRSVLGRLVASAIIRGRIALVVAAVGMVVGACGGAATGSGPSGTSPSGTTRAPASVAPASSLAPASVAPAPPVEGQAVDACSLLSDEEIEQTLGYPVKTKTPGSVMGIFANGCSWEVDSAAEQIVDWSLDVGVISPGGRQYYDTYLGPYDGEPISGLGDVAQESDAGGINGVKGDTLVSVFLIAMGSGADEERMTRELTEAALSHL